MNKRSLLNTRKAMRLSLMLCLCYSLVGLYSCHNDDNGMYNKGKLRFQMEADTTLVNSTLDKSSRSSHFSDFEDPKTYKVVISQNSEVVAEFDSYADMPEEIELEEGQYSIEASKGTETTAAFESPYFSGKQDFNIVKDKTTPVEVTASLQNSLVTVDYSKDFIETYKDYTLSFKTNKMELPLIYEKGEDRAMYFQSDAEGTKLTIGMSLVNVYGKEVEYTATTTIKPKQWSKLTVSTDGKGLNGIALDVILNDGTKEPVYINIGIPDFMEQLKGAPNVNCEAFHWESTNISMEQPSECTKDECSASAMVNIIAGGKINQVLLNLKDNEDNILINNYDLVNLTDEQKIELKEKYGFEVPEDALKQGSVSGNIDLKSLIASFLSKVEDSFYELSLTVIDGMPVPNKTIKSVKINVPKAGDNTITWSFDNNLSFDYASYNQGEQTVEVNVPIGIKTALISIDGLGIENQELSQAISGINVDKSADKIILTFTPEWFNSLFCNENKTAKKYTVTLNITDNLDRTIGDNSRSFTVNAPVFEWASEIDAFAKYAIVDIKTNHREKVSFYNNDKLIEAKEIESDNGVVTFVIKNLSPTTQYNLTAKYNNDDRLALEQKSFETEEAIQLPNAGMNEWTKEFICNNVGTEVLWFKGKDIDRWHPYINSDNSFWETNNEETTSGNPSPSFWLKAFPTVYSAAYAENYNPYKKLSFNEESAAVINTVGWGSGLTWISGEPTNTAGRLYVNNKSWKTRPRGISFKCQFESYNGEKFKVVFSIKDNSNNEIKIDQELSNENILDGKVKLLFDSNLPGKAFSISLDFISSSSPSPSTQKVEGKNNDNIGGFTESSAKEGGHNDSRYIGNVLIIDDIELIYDYE